MAISRDLLNRSARDHYEAQERLRAGAAQGWRGSGQGQALPVHFNARPDEMYGQGLSLPWWGGGVR